MEWKRAVRTNVEWLSREWKIVYIQRNNTICERRRENKIYIYLFMHWRDKYRKDKLETNNTIYLYWDRCIQGGKNRNNRVRE